MFFSFQPVAVESATDKDRSRWREVQELPAGVGPVSKSRSQFFKPEPCSFNLFSRNSSPTNSSTSEQEMFGLIVTLVIAMPSPPTHSSRASGELYLGVARASLL
ncbi:hypothetical protein BD414DRAFT_497681 [Trametes punicea]|nr:hypothetical protein BD414DRAFT_497681 [Trametes punicea]